MASPPAAPVPAPATDADWVARAHRATIASQIKEAWRTRIVIIFLAEYFIRTAYHRTLLGILWLFLRPFIMVIPYTFVFRDILGVDSGEIPYPVFVLCGLLGWFYFQRGLAWTTRSLYRCRRIFYWFYFPRVIAFACSFAPVVVESGIVLISLLALSLYYKIFLGIETIYWGWNLFFVVPILLYISAAVTAITLFTSVLFTYAKDAWYILRYAIPLMLFATPVLYPLDIVPEHLRDWMLCNPLSPILLSLRAAFFDTAWPPLWSLLSSLAAIGFLNILGLLFFTRWEARVLDEAT